MANVVLTQEGNGVRCCHGLKRCTHLQCVSQQVSAMECLTTAVNSLTCVPLMTAIVAPEAPLKACGTVLVCECLSLVCTRGTGSQTSLLQSYRHVVCCPLVHSCCVSNLAHCNLEVTSNECQAIGSTGQVRETLVCGQRGRVERVM